MNTPAKPIIKFENVSLRYRTEKSDALERVNFSVNKGEFVCLIGQSGGGKTSILRLIADLTTPTSGTIERPGTVAMVFQNGALLPWRTVRQNIALGLEARKDSPEAIAKIVAEEVARLGLEAVADKRPNELSGGQRQRVGIARALAIHPDVLLLDEPFSALDPKTTAELRMDVLQIWKATGATIVMVSHSIDEAVTLAERIFLIQDRHIAKTFDNPLPYPRREQGAPFIHEVLDIEKEFFRKN